MLLHGYAHAQLEHGGADENADEAAVIDRHDRFDFTRERSFQYRRADGLRSCTQCVDIPL